MDGVFKWFRSVKEVDWDANPAPLEVELILDRRKLLPAASSVRRPRSSRLNGCSGYPWLGKIKDRLAAAADISMHMPAGSFHFFLRRPIGSRRMEERGHPHVRLRRLCDIRQLVGRKFASAVATSGLNVAAERGPRGQECQAKQPCTAYSGGAAAADRYQRAKAIPDPTAASNKVRALVRPQ